MNLEESLKKLYSLHQFGVKLGLDKPKHLFNYLGNPQDNLKCFHVAGSNAKGSVASFIASILTEDGNSVGLYTSPHFVKFNERIRINGEMIPDEFVVDFMNEIDSYIDENEPTFFELTTAMAFKYFAETKVDFAVIETGLGGRLDATNVINPIASVITTISLEHTNILGNTLEEIAFEKGEIIKRGGKVIIGYLNSTAKKVLTEKAKTVDAQLIDISDFTKIENDYLQLSIADRKFTIYSTPLGGKYQRKNAALGILTLDQTYSVQDKLAYFKGINNVIKNSGIQGRYEVFNDSPRIIFDSSHNTEGIENFISEFKYENDNYDRCELLFGVMKDKDVRGMLEKLNRVFDQIYITSFDYERAAPIEQVTAIADEIGIAVTGMIDPERYIKKFAAIKENRCLVVMGSIYLLGQIKSKLITDKT